MKNNPKPNIILNAGEYSLVFLFLIRKFSVLSPSSVFDLGKKEKKKVCDFIIKLFLC